MLQCPRCKHDNPAGQKFCGECGTRVASLCLACGATSPAGQRFCGECGAPLAAPGGADLLPASYTPKHLAQKILTSRAVLEGERKVVTVFFADVSGFTALAERLDPEDVHQLMDRAFELMLAEVHRYEGTVNQFLGDGLMALFGAPITHEDHAVRAVRAALGIRHALAGFRERLSVERGIDFRVRMGLNTGAVVVGKIGDNLRMDYTAVGDTTNLAARLLALAEPEQILIGDDTARAAGPYFVLRSLGEVSVKGKALPVRAHRVDGSRSVRSRLEAEAERGLTPLVGRERELALLRDRFDEVQRGSGQAVFLYGEAGVGKSRLLHEFRPHAEAAGARWVLGRCVSYGHAISYLPILDLVRDLLGIEEGDSLPTVQDKLEMGLRRAGTETVWAGPYLRALLSLDPGDPTVTAMAPVQRRGRIEEAVGAVVTAESRRHPVVLVVEDLHWIDPHSRDVVRLLLQALATVPLMLVLTQRPDHASPYPEQTYYTRITLRGLPDSLTEAMVEGVLGSARVPAEACRLIARRAEGNPLFLEELTKALVEDGTLERGDGGYQLARPLGEVGIPDTVQGVIMARIDRLPEVSKAALQVASVIGREFTARLVERVAAMDREGSPALRELRAVELIYEKTSYPELVYMFKHALTHDVAYESLLRQTRRTLHQRAGEVIEEIYADRLAELYETLAWHYVRGEVWDKAVDYLHKAADKARGQHAYDEAARFCREAVDVLDRHRPDADVLLDALERLGDLESLRGGLEQANRGYDRALGLATAERARQRIGRKRHRVGTATRDGARIVFYEHGQGEPTLFLLSPTLYGIETFQPIVELLCQEFRVISYDPRGTGASDPLSSIYLRRDRAEEARAVIEAAGGGPVVVLGLSDGGRVGIVLATAHPHLVDKLVLFAAPPSRMVDYPGGLDPDFVPEIRRAIEAGDFAAVNEVHDRRIFSEPGTQHLREARVRARASLGELVQRSFFNPQPDPDSDVRPLLPALRVPTLLLHGDRDRCVPLSCSQYLAETIRDARLHVIPGHGHTLIFTATADVARAVTDFVRSGRPA